MVAEYRDVFREEPGWVRGTFYAIKTLPGAITRERW